DPRVPYTEAEQIVAKVRANGTRVWYLRAENEGHGFARKDNADFQFYATVLRAMWREEGVDDSGVRSDGDAFTAVYFVTHDAAGHHFSFFRRGSAASRLDAAQLPHAQIAAARVLHLSGISMAIS